MARREQDQFMARVWSWAKEERGRQHAIALALRVSDQVVSNWLYGRKTPTLDNWLALQEFARCNKIPLTAPSTRSILPRPQVS